ncbi:MAG: hypothetical protein ACM3SY_14865 [Candidatus Omnitrophota bacterium]
MNEKTSKSETMPTTTSKEDFGWVKLPESGSEPSVKKLLLPTETAVKCQTRYCEAGYSS